MKERHAGRALPYEGCRQDAVSQYTMAAVWPLPILQTAFQALLATLGIPIGDIPGNRFLP
jgi:hypothetical protein